MSANFPMPTEFSAFMIVSPTYRERRVTVAKPVSIAEMQKRHPKAMLVLAIDDSFTFTTDAEIEA